MGTEKIHFYSSPFSWSGVQKPSIQNCYTPINEVFEMIQ